MRIGQGTSGTTSRSPTFAGEKEHEIGNLFEKIIKENFSNLVREIHM